MRLLSGRFGALSTTLLVLAVGCSREVSRPAGSGGATTASSTSSSGGAGGGGGGSGGAPACQTLHLGKLRGIGSAYFEADIVENIIGPQKDVLSISFYESPTQSTWTGVQDLGSPQNSNFATCTSCLNIYSDDTGPVFFQTQGTLNLGSALVDFEAFDTGFIPDGSLAMAHFVEVAVDIPTRVSTPLPNGRCFDIPMGDLKMTVPPSGWTCEKALYDDATNCDCNCGVVDTDCSNSAYAIPACLPGQTCSPTTATCTGVPTAWTCSPADYAAGAANGCDCACGARDPDCDLTPAPALKHCGAGDSCNVTGKCVPAAWTCDKDYFGQDTTDSCDCGCGAKDPDCPAATKPICNSCDDAGSCSTVSCTDPASNIDSVNNAICN